MTLGARIIFAGAHEIVDFRHTRPIIARFIRARNRRPWRPRRESRAGRGLLRQLGDGLQRQCGGGRLRQRGGGRLRQRGGGLLRQRGGGPLRQCAHEIVYFRHASPRTATFIRAAVDDPR